ncbi:hypothetical protein GCM10009786_09600 [Leucobacter alluvii]|uniref:MFS transporter n=1 Tax=Leucobacter alluvii TaxID=340321 RepID=A0ABN3B4P1_9MICO
MTSSRAERTSRGLVVAAIASFIAVFSHAVADGGSVPVLGLLLALVFSAPVCIALAGRRLSWTRLALAVGASQFAFHGLLSLGLGGGSFALGAGGHQHELVQSAQVLPFGGAEAAVHLEHGGHAMWIAHACAAVLTVLAIGVGERALVAILGLARLQRVAALFDWSPRPEGDPRPVLAAWRFIAPRLTSLTEMRRRGPPRAA